MSRKVTTSLQRRISEDRKYQSVLVQRLINKSMLNGKKQVAERAVYAAIEGAAKNADPFHHLTPRSIFSSQSHVRLKIQTRR